MWEELRLLIAVVITGVTSAGAVQIVNSWLKYRSDKNQREQDHKIKKDKEDHKHDQDEKDSEVARREVEQKREQTHVEWLLTSSRRQVEAKDEEIATLKKEQRENAKQYLQRTEELSQVIRELHDAAVESGKDNATLTAIVREHERQRAEWQKERAEWIARAKFRSDTPQPPGG